MNEQTSQLFGCELKLTYAIPVTGQSCSRSSRWQHRSFRTSVSFSRRPTSKSPYICQHCRNVLTWGVRLKHPSETQRLRRTTLESKKKGLPWWLRGKESTGPCRRHGFNPWARKIPQATERLSPCAPQLLSLCSGAQEPHLLSLHAVTTKVHVPHSPRSTT